MATMLATSFSISRNWEVFQKRQMANRVLVEAGLRFIYWKEVSAEIVKNLFDLAEDAASDLRHFTQGVIRELRFRNDKRPKGILSKLRQLDKKITGKSFWEHFCRFVLYTTWDEDNIIEGDNVKELSAPSHRVDKLVREVVKKPIILAERLFSMLVSSEGHRLHEFGRRLAKKLNGETLVSQIIEAQLGARPSGNTQFIGGYFIGLEHDPVIWEKYITKLLALQRTRDLGVTIVQWSGTSEALLRKLLNLYNRKKNKGIRV